MADITFGLPIGTMLDDRYKVQEIIGSGGFGITYKAEDTKQGVACAIKELFPRQLAVREKDGKTVSAINKSDTHSFEHSKERFGEEALALQALRNVEGIVDVTDYFEQHGTCYFVMEYLDGVNLRQLAKNNGGRLGWQELSYIVLEAGKALSDMHKNRLFHRDISPDNIIYTKNMEVKLIDCGNAKELARTNNEGLSVFLKPYFAPLEQYSSKRSQGTYTDVYSFAATIYYLLTGRKVPDAVERFTGSGYIKLDQFGFASYISDAIDKALVVDYKNRTQTIDKLLTDLRLIDGSESETDRINEKTEVDYDPGQSSGADNNPVREDAILEVHIGSSIQTYILPRNNCIFVGRSPERCNIVVNVGYVGRQHLEIMYDDMAGELYVRDCKSRNGTYINQTYAKMVPDRIMKVPFGTIMYLGGKGCWIRVVRR